MYVCFNAHQSPVRDVLYEKEGKKMFLDAQKFQTLPATGRGAGIRFLAGKPTASFLPLKQLKSQNLQSK